MPPPSQLCPQFARDGSCFYGDGCRFQHVRIIQAIPANTSQRPANSTPAQARQRTRPHKRSKRRPRNAQAVLKSSPLQEFFSEFTLFTYNPSSPATDEFYRLVLVYQWRFDDAVKKEAHERFKDAMVEEFNIIYGTDVDDIDAWRALCRVLDILPVPETLESCREKVKSTHVNLVDLLHNRKSGEAVQKFTSELELSEYTLENHRIFPRENAYAGGLLRYLLRHINNPSVPSSRKNRRRKR